MPFAGPVQTFAIDNACMLAVAGAPKPMRPMAPAGGKIGAQEEAGRTPLRLNEMIELNDTELGIRRQSKLMFAAAECLTVFPVPNIC
jgi:hypothetical protein